MDLSRYLDVPDAQLQQYFPGQDIAALKEAIRNAGKTETSSKPVTQTIKTDPVTGQQEVTIKGSPQDLSAANPLTPTVSGPVTPQAYNQFTAQMESGANPNIGYHDQSRSSAYGKYGITQPQYQEIQQQNPQFANRPITSLSQQEQDAANMSSRDVYARQLAAKGVDPTEENIRTAHLLGAGGTNQFLRDGTFNQAALAANGGEENLRRMVQQRRAGPVAPVAPGQPQGRPQPMIAGQASSDVGTTPTEQAINQMRQTSGSDSTLPGAVPQWQIDLQNASKNPTKLYAMAGNEELPEEVRNIARDQAVQFDTNFKARQQANETARAAADPNDPKHRQASNEMMKAVRDKSGNGSWLKAILLQGAGFTGAADRELRKLEGGEIKQVILDGQSYSVRQTPDGGIVAGWDKTGTALDDTKLAEINAGATTQGTAQYSFTGEGGVVVQNGQQIEVKQRQNNRTGTVDNIIVTGPNKGQVYKGDEMPVAKSVGTSNLKEMGRQQIQGAWTGPNASNKAAGTFAGEFNQRTGSNIGVREVRPGEMEYFDKNTGMPAVNSQGQFRATVPTMPTVPAARQGQPSAQGPVPPQTQAGRDAAVANQPSLTAPAQPVSPQQAAAQPPAPAPGPAAGVSPTPGIPGSTPLRAFDPTKESPAQYQAYEKAWQTEQAELAKEVANIKLNLPKLRSNSDAVIKTVDSVLNHKGFTDVVGVPNILTGIYSPPGTEARGAKAKIKELEGKQFLQAFETLKGGGTITEVEGQKATQAIAALQDPGISEAEYRRNATIFKNGVRRMTNRQLEMAGLPPKYTNEQMEIEETKKVGDTTYTFDGIGWKAKK